MAAELGSDLLHVPIARRGVTLAGASEGRLLPQAAKFTSSDGRQLFAMTAGDWTNLSVYHLTIVPFRLEPSKGP